MSGWFAYALGCCTPVALVALLLAYIGATDTGKQIECRVCGYDTGPLDTTWRATCRVRFGWHKLTTGHHTPWGPRGTTR